ncbi:MAG: Bug family tripartite tricarboxylate transporter substrate binding protein [Burkholderiaceae bacterium]
MSTRSDHFSLNTPRRRALAVGLAAVAGALHGPARAQATAWPTKPVRVIVPYPAGGVVDVMTRAVTQRMQADLGQPIIVEAKPGANANIGADTVATAAPDGHTWLVSAAYLLNNPLIETGLRWKPADFVPVARFALSPSYFVVPVSSPARTLKEWVEFARREPGQQYGEGGTGTPQSMSIQMLWASAGLRLEPVMYKGAPPIVPDLIAGQLSMSVLPSTVAIPQVRSGKLRALANTSTTRSPSLPDVPTMAEAGFPEASVLSWYGFHVPTGTPTEIVRRIAEFTGRAATSAEVGERLAAAGGESGFLAGPDFIAFMTDEQQRWARFVEAAKKNAR